MKVLVIGASKNIGYFAAQRLLASGATVTFLLRNKTVFDNDDIIKPYISSGKAKVVHGDALKEADVQRAWDVAAEGDDNSNVDALIFTVGGAPTFSVTRGFAIDQPNLCSSAMLNVLSTIPHTTPQPKVILVSSTGLDRAGHASLPLVLKPLYSLLKGPHADKLGLERVVAHAAGRAWVEEEPKPDILPTGWQGRLPEPGFLQRVLVVRPALLTDGNCKAEVGKGTGYRVEDRDFAGCYTVSRKDVAHFIFKAGFEDWSQWEGKCARIAY